MSNYKFSNVPEGETRDATIMMIVRDGSSWCVAHQFSAEQIARLENLLAEISEEVSTDAEKKD